MTNSNTGALDGIRVVDLTRILAGPLCTMMLGDMGADVIKIEPPTGDDTRRWGPPFAGDDAAYFLGINRNKRSLTLNMAVPEGQKVLAGLVEKADVLIDNFRIGTLEKWGFTEAWFEAHAPRLIRCSITGYGTSGPRAALPGYDFILQAESGLMSICGEPGGVPTKYGVAIVDVCTGMLASNAILAAINARHRTGKGQKVELSLYETSLSMLINVAQNYLVAGRDGGRFGNGHPSIVPYTTYRTADAMIAIGIGNERQFSRAAEVLGHPEWAQDAALQQQSRAGREPRRHRRQDQRGTVPRYCRRLARQAHGGGRAVRQDQHGGAGARRSAHRGSPHGRDGRAPGHRHAAAARHPVQVLRHHLLGTAAAADARRAHRRSPLAGIGAGRRDDRGAPPAGRRVGAGRTAMN